MGLRRRWNPDPLPAAIRLLKSEPWRVPGFLSQLGMRPELTVHYYDGSQDQAWGGDPVEWQQHLAHYAEVYGIPLEDVLEGRDDMGWTIRNWELTQGRSVTYGDHWHGELDLLAPYVRSMEALAAERPQ